MAIDCAEIASEPGVLTTPCVSSGTLSQELKLVGSMPVRMLLPLPHYLKWMLATRSVAVSANRMMTISLFRCVVCASVFVNLCVLRTQGERLSGVHRGTVVVQQTEVYSLVVMLVHAFSKHPRGAEMYEGIFQGREYLPLNFEASAYRTYSKNRETDSWVLLCP